MILSFKNVYQRINQNPLLVGLMVLLVNLGGRYVDLQLTKSQVAFLKGAFVRELFIFALVWMSTRDLITSFILTASFMILANYLFNEKSSMCILPPKYKEISKIIDANDDGFVSDEEIEKAHDLLRKADNQKKKINQAQAISYLNFKS